MAGSHRGTFWGSPSLAGVSQMALGAAPAPGGCSWHCSRLVQAEIPAGFVLLRSHRVSAVDGEVMRADSAVAYAPGDAT